MLRVGIVGLPNVGKSTLFNALVRGGQAEVAAYPFCTIEPNVGVIEVPDPRVETLRALYGSAKGVPSAVEFFDIAGLVKGASRGEGLGNQFLAHIREVEAVVQVVRCFAQGEVAHVDGELDPVRDMETIAAELALADLATVGKRKEKARRDVGHGDREARTTVEALETLEEALGGDRPLRAVDLTPAARALADELFLLTAKPMLVAANVGEEELGGRNGFLGSVGERAAHEGAEVVEVSAELEAQLADLCEEDAADYLAALGVERRGTALLVEKAYEILGLITFFTGNETELRARALPAGSTAWEAAGRVHTDMQRGFIRAEVIHWEKLVEERSFQHAREDGRLRIEGKDYVVQDGDVVLFRFNA